MENKSNLYIKLFAGLIILALGIFFIKNTVFAQPLQPKETTEIIETVSVEAKMNNGVQEAELSWGKFNYNPQEITVKKGIPVHILGDTERLQGCFRSLEIKELGVSKTFTENDKILEFTPEKTGNYRFSCAMGMGTGTLHVQ